MAELKQFNVRSSDGVVGSTSLTVPEGKWILIDRIDPGNEIFRTPDGNIVDSTASPVRRVAGVASITLEVGDKLVSGNAITPDTRLDTFDTSVITYFEFDN